MSIIETDLQSKVEAARAAAAAAESKETEDAKQRRSQIEQEAEKDLQRQEATKKSLFSEKDLTASDWAWNAAAQHRFQRRVQQRLSFPRWEFAAFVFCLGGAIFSSSMRTTRSLLECPSAAGALADTFDAPCDNDVVARDPSATLSNGSLPIVYRYRYVDDDGLYKTVAVTSTDAFSEKLEPAEVWLERNFYWWDTNGFQSVDGHNDASDFVECGGTLGRVARPTDGSWIGYSDPRGEPCNETLLVGPNRSCPESTWHQACEGCHCGFFPRPYSDIEWSSALPGRLGEGMVFVISGSILAFTALVVPLVCMVVVLFSFGRCAIYFGNPKYVVFEVSMPDA